MFVTIKATDNEALERAITTSFDVFDLEAHYGPF